MLIAPGRWPLSYVSCEGTSMKPALPLLTSFGASAREMRGASETCCASWPDVVICRGPEFELGGMLILPVPLVGTLYCATATVAASAATVAMRASFRIG